jgi:CubicO group peptidase (beta-lactamase class C family)
MSKHWLFAIVLAVAPMAFAEELPLDLPAAVGMSAERLARIDGMLNGYIERQEVSGFVTLVARRGKIVHWKAHGLRAIGSDEPMPRDAIFDVASMTKLVAVVSGMMLYEEGRFLMYEPISNYLPEFRDPVVQVGSNETVAAAREINAHDLFTHTSGVDDPLTRVEMFNYPTLAEHMKVLAREPLRFHPGEQWLYGDSHDVLGYLVQVVSGTRLDRFWQERIFDPLGMTDTYYWLPAEEKDRRAILLYEGENDPEMTSRYPAIAAERKTYYRGAGGLNMTAVDYWRLCQMLLNGGELNGVRLLSPKTVEWMTSNHIGDIETAEWVGSRFGLGVAVIEDPAHAHAPFSKGTYWWAGSQGTNFWVDPDEELVGIVMAQVYPNEHLVTKWLFRFQTLVYSSIVD